MIDVAISYGFGDDNRYNLYDIPRDIQLALFKYKNYIDQREQIISALKAAETNVHTIHLPLDTMKRPSEDMINVIKDLNLSLGCSNFIVHPNKGFTKFSRHFISAFAMNTKYNCRLTVETFQWRKRKELRSPLDILETCIKYPKMDMCIDTSHIESLWMDYKIMRTLLKYTTVIHLSNRAKGHGSHMPFNSPHGDLNLVGFVKELKRRYKWNGIIVLEYMPEHQGKLIKNYYYIKKLLE